jgi:NAD(P)-dependent dehydrogenase (short-subunit alcohol dehydrogenase family)
MGAAEAKLFAQEGAKVVIGDVLDDEGRKTESEINETGGECLFVRLDVASEDSWADAIATTVSRFGKLDVLVNNAGVVARGTLEDTTIDDYDRIMDINAKGVFLGTKAAIPELRKAGGGSIVNIASISGNVGQSDVQAVYNASKGAVRIFTKSAAIQYAGEGIRVNSVHPGDIDTPMAQARLNDPQLQREAEARSPLGRTDRPEEVAYGVLYLASDESSFVTGSELVIDGGYTAQ